jgi:hypothetical protein
MGLREPLSCWAANQQAVTAVDAQIAGLAPVLNAAFADGYVTTTSNVRAMAKRGPDGAWYVFAGSRGGSGNATFTVKAGSVVSVVGEARTLSVSGGQFTDTFANGNAVHIYRIS